MICWTKNDIKNASILDFFYAKHDYNTREIMQFSRIASASECVK